MGVVGSKGQRWQEGRVMVGEGGRSHTKLLLQGHRLVRVEHMHVERGGRVGALRKSLLEESLEVVDLALGDT